MTISLMEILKELPLKTVNGQRMIPYTDIMNELRIRGFNNHDLLNAQLQNLAADGLSNLYFDKECEALIIGVTIK